MTAALHCPACEVGWKADDSTRCWSCGAPGHAGALVVPGPPLTTYPTPRPALSPTDAYELASNDAMAAGLTRWAAEAATEGRFAYTSMPFELDPWDPFREWSINASNPLVESSNPGINRG